MRMPRYWWWAWGALTIEALQARREYNQHHVGLILVSLALVALMAKVIICDPNLG